MNEKTPCVSHARGLVLQESDQETGACGAEPEAQTGAFAEHGLHALFEAGEILCGDEGLHRAGEAAAVNTDGAVTAQKLPSQRQCQSKGLLIGIAGVDVLERENGGVAGLVHQPQEGGEIVHGEGVRHGVGTAVLLIEMESAEYGPIAAGAFSVATFFNVSMFLSSFIII